MRRMRWLALAVCSSGLLVNCTREARLYSTWDSLGQKPGKTISVNAGELPPAGAQPWGGTVSHHLLADVQIDRWFYELSIRRPVSRFYILSPSHWGLSTQTFSITDGSWRTRYALVHSDRVRARALARQLGAALEPSVFDPEHGVSSLIPYIARYFPKATVVAIAYRGEPPLDQPMAEHLFRILSPAFTEVSRKENFLVVSTDFSHHGDLQSTRAKDARSAMFFKDPSFSTGILVACDNRPGIYVLSKFLEPASKASVLFHCESSQLTGEDSDDITSYFFSYFW